jgi:hypothetical protein
MAEGKKGSKKIQVIIDFPSNAPVGMDKMVRNTFNKSERGT